MEQSSIPQARPQPKPNKINYACEACRMSKIKCQPGTQPGICKRCSEFKRECVFRTGPRTRRPKVARPDAEARPPPPGPSRTFSIDFAMPADDDLHDNFDALREKHERFIDALIPSSDDESNGDQAQLSLAGETFNFNDLSMPTPSGAAARCASASRPISSLGIKPRFNLESAEKLLESFRAMLSSSPCIALPEDADVRTLARDMPFVLLSLLAVTSCSTSLQGHSLYDEEFRKILALKFVAGGERSIELLQGIMIYCSWYPFHLRPKNTQLRQYLRMAIDIVHDLGLDEETRIDLEAMPPESKAAKLQSIRAYLSCFHHSSIYAWAWSKPYTLRYTPWMAQCCDMLEQYSDLEQDHILVWLVRLQYLINEFEELYKRYKKRDASNQSDHHRQLIRVGLEMQLRDFQTRIPIHLSTKPSILMASLAGDAFLLAAPLMQTHRPRPEDATALMIDPAKLQSAAYTARTFLDYVANLSPTQMSYFSGADITYFISTIILAYRLSFPMSFCPGYDYTQGRKILDFGTYLTKLSSDTDDDDAGSSSTGRASKKTDVVSAMKVVLGSVKASFDKKSAVLEAAAEEHNKRARLCPMFDGSLEQYLPQWEGEDQQGSSSNNTSDSSYAPSSHSGTGTGSSAAHAAAPSTAGEEEGVGSPGSAKPMLFHDLWTTMTMGWAADLDMNLQQVVDVPEINGVEYVDLMGVREPFHDL
ncbi:hypothetical protein F5Y00DRAFT_201952 [Daldinia vernicosa]|uniref:uncharacterized protein n=1 Tax=Daldinia vernicosa TaxID=114800 RepID=UPI002008AF0E|nr:uncharacterized protein F5Y00DRAFT_201952 [Daldinia vernicosa]KAI0844302.1 hypothetical protein F5Y00DRAFT_201952 [Daldinia vernicosa]